MSISVATAVVAPSAPSSVAAPAAPAGAGDLAFQNLLETFSSGAGHGGETLPPATRVWADRAQVTGAMPADLASASAGTARTRTDAPLETDARSARPGDSSDQTATLGNLPILQVLPLPAPASLPAVDATAVAAGAAPGPLAGLSGPSIAATDARDRSRASGSAAESKTPSTDRSPIAVAGLASNQPAIGIDGNRAAGSTDGQAHSQADGFGLQGSADQTTTDAATAPASPSFAVKYGANTEGRSAGVQPAAVAAFGSAIGLSHGSNLSSPQAVASSTDVQNGTTVATAGPKGPALRPVDANEADRFVTRTESIAVEKSGRPGPFGPGIDVQFDAPSQDWQATRKSSSLASADPGAPTSSDLGATATVAPRDQAALPVSPAATTIGENPAGGAADRRSAAGVRLAAALARGARAEGTPGSGRTDGPAAAGGADRFPGADGADRTKRAVMSVDPDPRDVSSAGAAGVNAQADRRVDRLRSEPLLSTFAAAAPSVEQMPLRAGVHESADTRTAMGPAVDLASDVKASGQAALFAAPVAGVGAPSSHAVPAAVATAQPALDPAAESDLPRQIVQAMRLQWKDGIGDARIRLLPDYLGELTIAIRVEHGTVLAALEASTPAVRQWIESHEPMLRQSLAEHGLHLDRLIVSDEPQQSSLNRERRREKGDETQQEPQPQPRRRPQADDTTFEVLV